MNKIVFLSFIFLVSFFLSSCGGGASSENTGSTARSEGELFGPSQDDQKIGTCRKSQYELITPGIYICEKKDSEEKKYILSEPGIVNSENLCELDIKPLGDFHAHNESCYCREKLFLDFVQYLKQGDTCYQKLKDRKKTIVL